MVKDNEVKKFNPGVKKSVETKRTRTTVRRWKYLEKRDQALDMHSKRRETYKECLFAEMSDDDKKYVMDNDLLTKSEESDSWWFTTYIVPLLKAKGVYSLRYEGPALTDEEKRWQEVYESKVER